MNQMTKEEMAFAKIRKAARSAIRLKHSLMADEELNEVLPRLEQEYRAALLSGKRYELDTASLLRDLDEDSG